MSDIRANTISDAAGTGPITLTKQSAAKAWARFNGTGTAVINNSTGISSLTDNGTGNYELAVINSFSSTGVSATAAQFDDGGGKTPTYAASASAIIVQFFSASNALADAGNLSSTAHGDLA